MTWEHESGNREQASFTLVLIASDRDATVRKELCRIKEKEIIRLYYELSTQREICNAPACGYDRMSKVIKAVKNAGVDQETADSLGDCGIRELLLPTDKAEEAFHAVPDFEKLTRELEKPGVTRKLLWYKYCNDFGDAGVTLYGYSQFCKLFDDYLKVTNAKMCIVHKPGHACSSTGPATRPRSSLLPLARF